MMARDRGKTTVINLRGQELGDAVYIGRAVSRRGLKHSPWANPYRMTKQTTREEAIEKYRQHLRENPDLVERARRELKGKTLACWCAPKPCHGDVLAAVADGEAP